MDYWWLLPAQTVFSALCIALLLLALFFSARCDTQTQNCAFVAAFCGVVVAQSSALASACY